MNAIEIKKACGEICYCLDNQNMIMRTKRAIIRNELRKILRNL